MQVRRDEIRWEGEMCTPTWVLQLLIGLLGLNGCTRFDDGIPRELMPITFRERKKLGQRQTCITIANSIVPTTPRAWVVSVKRRARTECH